MGRWRLSLLIAPRVCPLYTSVISHQGYYHTGMHMCGPSIPAAGMLGPRSDLWSGGYACATGAAGRSASSRYCVWASSRLYPSLPLVTAIKMNDTTANAPIK
jgi:hypothetical protein